MSAEVDGDFIGQVAGRDVVNSEVIHKGNVCYVSFGANHGGQQIIGNEHVHIHMGASALESGIKVVIHPGPERIDDMQRAVIRGLVDKVVHLEKTARHVPNLYKTVWGALNARMRVNSYKFIKTRDYELATKFLLEWIGDLMMARSGTKGDPGWRERKGKPTSTDLRNRGGAININSPGGERE